MDSHGMYYRYYRERFPYQLLFITEFGNVNDQVGLQAKGKEYVMYGPCLIEITVRRVDERLHLEVMDNGPGIRDGCDSDHHAGMGLRNTRERLQQLYGCRFSCELEHRPDGGCAARITIPYVTQPVGTAQHGD